MSSTSLVVQSPFIADVFAENPEPRCPCVLVLDTSGSMSGKPIDQLNAGYQALLTELLEDALASKRVELAVTVVKVFKLCRCAPTALHIVVEGAQRFHVAAVFLREVCRHNLVAPKIERAFEEFIVTEGLLAESLTAFVEFLPAFFPCVRIDDQSLRQVNGIKQTA